MSRRESKAGTPAGLVHAFRLIREDDHTKHFAGSTANEVLPFAEQILRCLQGEGSSDRVKAILDAGADEMYEWDTCDPHDVPDMAQTSAYYIGFAVCWLLMREINRG